MESKLVNAEQRHVISAVTFGNILEWFDVYSFAYLAPVLAAKFFPDASTTESLFFAFLVFGLGFLTRPVGGIIFGRIGDHIGRRRAFTLSIILLTIPTFCIGILPTYEYWGAWAPMSLFVLRLLQAIPTGGELPGTICYLYENAQQSNRRFMTSWNAVGNQIGAIVAIFECFIMDNFLPDHMNLEWGWRISFITGGFIGLFGIYLRHTLHETPIFERLKQSQRIDHETIRQLITHHRSKIITGTAFGVVDAAIFYLVATYIPTFISDQLHLSSNSDLVISFGIMLITTVLLPVFGYIGDKYSNRKILIFSTLLLLTLIAPLYFAINSKNLIALFVLGLLFLIPIVSITSLIAYLLGNLFPPQVRFTGIGISVNLSDGIIGGFTPSIALFLTWITGMQASFLGYVAICTLISLWSYYRHVKE